MSAEVIALDPHVFVFDRFFTPSECKLWLKMLDDLPAEAPNSMNKYGKIVHGDLVSSLQFRGVEAWRSQYPGVRKLRKRPYAFVVDYTPKTQRSLARHFDSSDLTLNICLGRDFKGGDLVFYKGRDKKTVVEHRVGQAILHRGSHEHRAMPLESGHRTNLILWCREYGSEWA